MRTPNSECIVCHKPLYRRPSEKSRYAACMEHRAQAQVLAGITEAQQRGLALGRTDNHRNGRPDTAETKARKSERIAAYWAKYPELAIARGAKIRGPLHRLWKGGASKFNTSIRQMNEHRKWTGSVKARDGDCVRCGSADSLEAHHLTPLADLLTRYRITTRDEARLCAALWRVDNGLTLCVDCHYAEHGRSRKCE